jgi:glycosyltransferase involved in cell wall biosynthesis
MIENMKPQGGTELLNENLRKYVDSRFFDGINLIVSNTDPDLIRGDQINVLWNHHSYDQAAAANMKDEDYVSKIDYFVYVSHWQHEKYRYILGTPDSKSLVIKNAIPSLDLVEKKKRIKLVYASTPWRGLDVLLDSFEILGRDDVELDVYSSTIIYGLQFYKESEAHFKDLFERAKSMKNVNYLGFAPNATVRKAFQDSHILAYPSIWEETSCLTAIEAAMAGCSVVTTNLGALPETLAEWATYVSIDGDRKALAAKYASVLNRAIDEFWQEETQSRLKAQHLYYKRFWTWEKRGKEWMEFLSSIKHQPPA